MKKKIFWGVSEETSREIIVEILDKLSEELPVKSYRKTHGGNSDGIALEMFVKTTLENTYTNFYSNLWGNFIKNFGIPVEISEDFLRNQVVSWHFFF